MKCRAPGASTCEGCRVAGRGNTGGGTQQLSFRLRPERVGELSFHVKYTHQGPCNYRTSVVYNLSHHRESE